MAPVVAASPPKRPISHAAATAAKAIRLPTERSMPAVMMTIVMPIATMAMTAIWLATLRRFSARRKVGQRYDGGTITCATAPAGSAASTPRTVGA